jgi:hypothetical protein
MATLLLHLVLQCLLGFGQFIGRNNGQVLFHGRSCHIGVLIQVVRLGRLSILQQVFEFGAQVFNVGQDIIPQKISQALFCFGCCSSTQIQVGSIGIAGKQKKLASGSEVPVRIDNKSLCT